MPVEFDDKISTRQPWRFRVTRIHAEDVGNEQRRLVAAGAGADFEDDVAFVVWIFGQQQELEFRLAFVETIFEPGEFFLRHGLQFGIGLFAHHHARFVDAALEVFVFAEFCDEFTEFGVTFRRLLVALAVGDDFRVGKLVRQFIVASFDSAQSIDEQIGGRTHTVIPSVLLRELGLQSLPACRREASW